jgi:hypothetical protein
VPEGDAMPCIPFMQSTTAAALFFIIAQSQFAV